MHEGKGADTFALSPYVAAGIIEHAKRLNCSAGYLVGDRSEGQVHVKDYIPCTHTNAEALLEEEFRKKMKAHLDIKKLSSPGVSILGWYAAGAPREGEVEAFNKWCMAPYVHFLQRNSLMVIAHVARTSLACYVKNFRCFQIALRFLNASINIVLVFSVSL
ncbi:putative JAB1 Mov34 MPN PAD 1 ubiquitin protease [Trypanosoma vivax]|uniref:JAB1/MPN/MOV34 metalloenzyme domain-containing protein n=1 Tax=Trypanosoma vivax (strain Y486) TaxID=1055687 RepID=G0TSH9_TRYVY|nr:putative JAB1 Mov34 MPN PAD 1 ubiquitin protease [Trypanosoma vivax]CCC46906.1 conserved hypothetical protein, in T. vivax [Trypanosoma vivax Y486]